MALYIGSKKVKIFFNGKKYNLSVNLNPTPNKLLSSDNFILKDSQGIYVIPKEVK